MAQKRQHTDTENMLVRREADILVRKLVGFDKTVQDSSSINNW